MLVRPLLDMSEIRKRGRIERCPSGDVAQAKLYTLTYGQQLRVEIDGAEVFSCLFGVGRGADQLGALASTARSELEARGWTKTQS